MASEYQLTTPDPDGPVLRLADMAWIPADPGNRDWQEYQQWLAEGGVPDPYVEPPTPESVPDSVASFNFLGRPAANAMVQVVVVQARTVPAMLAGSQAYAHTNPKGSPIFTLKKMAVAVGQRDDFGTITFQPDGTVLFGGTGGDLAAGDALQMVAPANMDQTIADVSISIAGM